jgi:4-amino-4-deoxy-L-arabinose transferase-like glycosyltransferase
MAILQGSSTQTDFVIAFWLICFVYFVIKFLVSQDMWWLWPIGISLGLAVLTKSTAYIFALPFVIWLAIRLAKMKSPVLFFRSVSVIALLALIINSGHFSRNFDAFGNPFGPENQNYLNTEVSVTALVSNIVRNLTLHLGTTPKVNAVMEESVLSLHNYIGIGINDPRTTYPNTAFFIFGPTTQEDFSGNLVHLLIGVIVGVTYLFSREPMGKFDKSVLKPYLLCLLLGFIFFSMLLKWQPWHSRLHLPLFALSAPLIGLFMENLRNRRLANLVMVFLWLGSLPWVFNNYRRPIIGTQSVLVTNRTDEIFRARPELQGGYERLAAFLNNEDCNQLGLISGSDSWEYPLWSMLKPLAAGGFHVEHVFVENESHRLLTHEALSSFSPCLWLQIDFPELERSPLLSEDYIILWEDYGLVVFVQE